MYKNLLLSRDGGIIDELHLCEADNAVFINIGLGGTGIDCLRKLKKKVYNNIVPDDIKSGNSVYNHIKFLAVDRDYVGLEQYEARESNNLRFTEDELFDISYKGSLCELFEQTGDEFGCLNEYKEWLRYRELMTCTADRCLCPARQVGRFMLFQNANEFVLKVGSLVSEAKKGLVGPRVYIHIYSGLGGVTGSGTFLDVCYLVRKALEAEGCNALIIGYFFLPDVNLSRVRTKETESFIKVNAYASLQELDYCMNFKRNYDKWSQEYPNIGLIETEREPVDLCYLIGSHDANGSILANGYEYALDTVAEYVLNYYIKSHEGFTLLADMGNLRWNLATIPKRTGANYEYIAIGNSVARIPYKEVLTYLSSYLFENMAKTQRNIASYADCDAFVKANGLGYESLFNMVMNGVDISFPEPDNRPRDVYENDDLVTTYFADLRSNAVGVAKRNIDRMKRGLYDRGIFDNSIYFTGFEFYEQGSIIRRIFNAINGIVIDPDKGPYFASSLISSTIGNDLVAYVNSYIETINSRIRQLEFILPKVEQQRELAQEKFFSSGHPSGRKYREYVATSKELIKQYTQQEILYEFRDFLSTLKAQIVELYTKFYRVYSAVITNLNETFIANKSYLENFADNIANYEYPIATIRDLKETLDNYLKDNFDVPSQMKVFHQHMLTADGYNAWKDNKENDISKYVSDYFSGIFKDYTNKGMTQYLQEKYGTDNTDTLIQNIRNDIMNILDSKAEPLYWTSNLYTPKDAGESGNITVPCYSFEVVEAATRYLNAKNPYLKLRESAVKDKITITKRLIGVPLYGYQPLCQYEDMSLMVYAPGKHLYEGKEYIDEDGNQKTGRDWRLLPSPIPFSLMNKKTPSMLLKIAQQRKNLYDIAEKMNVIHNSYDEYTVKIIDDEFMQEIECIANKAVKNKDVTKRDEVCQRIKEMRNSLMYNDTTYVIPNDAHIGDGCISEEYKKMVRIDHFVKSPVICDAVDKEIAKLNKIDELVTLLESKFDTDFEDYAMALFTGAIKIVGVQILYVDDFGMDVQLSVPNMPMGMIRLYQAYKNFKSLDENTRKKLKAIVDERNNMAIPAIETIEGCRNMTAQLNPQVKIQQLQVAKTRFVAEAEDILDFFDDLAEKLDEYISTHNILI